MNIKNDGTSSGSLVKVLNPDGSIKEASGSGEPLFVAWLSGPPLISTFTNDSGYITASVLPSFETDGILNTDQTVLNLISGTNIILTPDGSGGVTIDASNGGTVGPGTINEIAYFDSTTSILSLSTTTYPSLTELSYVKGVTSAIQTQLGTKAPTASPTFTGIVTFEYDATHLVPVEVLSSFKLQFGTVAGYPVNLPYQYRFHYSSAGTFADTGLAIKDDSSGPGIILHALTGGQMYITDDTGTAGGITVGVLGNPYNGADSLYSSGIGWYTGGVFTVNHAGFAYGQLETYSQSLPQLALVYDYGKYMTATIDTNGITTFTGTGSTPGFVFSNDIIAVTLATSGAAPTTSGTTKMVICDNNGLLSFDNIPTGGGITIGTSTITSGTDTKILYDNAGVVGEYTISGTGDVAMTNSPVFTTPNIGSATGSISGNAGTVTNGLYTGDIGTLVLSPTGSAAGLTSFPTLNQNTTGSAATLTTTRTIWGQNFNGSANVTGTLTLGANDLTMTGSLSATGARVLKGWFTDVESSNMPTVGGTSLSSTFSPIAGSASIVTVGTITSGTIGTGAVIAGATITLGSDASYDIYYRGATGILTRLANGTTGQFLGATTASAPSWQTPAGGGITVGTTTITSGANTKILYNNSGVVGEYTVASASTASAVMQRDANGNTSVNNIVDTYTSTATAAGTTTLTVSSKLYQNFSGTSTQTVVLPDATTLTVGHQFQIMNNSTGTVTLNMNGGTLLKTIPAGNTVIVTVTSIGTAAGVWTVNASIESIQWIRQSASRTLTNTTNIQKLFDSATNGALTVKAGYTYFFNGIINISGMSGTSGNMKFDVLGAGTATLTSTAWSAVGMDATTPGTAGANGGSFTATNVSTGNIVTAATGTAVFAKVEGIVVTNATGTLIPSIGLTTAVAATVGVNTYICFTPAGLASSNYTENWS